jgi:hypothetical protein
VGAHWSYIVARPHGRRGYCSRPVEVTTRSIRHSGGYDEQARQCSVN